jgi:predicted nucleic acid-binding protein
VSGTLAIIIKAKKAGLIPSVLPLLLKLQANGFRVADDVFASALRLSGERGNINL